MIRVATFANHQLSMTHTMESQRKVYDLQIQVSSGKVSSDYAGVGADVHRLVSLKTATARTDQYQANNEIVDQRLEAMETSVSQIYESATEFRTLLINALNANNAQEMGIDVEARNYKDEMAKLLNVEQDGRFLFSGSRTDTRPVDLTGWTPPVWPLTAPLTQYTDEYYKGDQVQLTTTADTDLTVNYGVTGDEDAFEYVLRAMHYVDISGPGVDKHTLETALALVNAALGTAQGDATLGVPALTRDLADIRTDIGISRRALENANTNHEDFQLYAQQGISNIENVDPAQALAQLSADQTQLEASYMVLTRLSQLSLMNYL
jgi:flagellar hook-associated protein 3 FlgL